MMDRNIFEELLAWGEAQNPGMWVAHCRNTAKTAEFIAEKAGLDTDKAYVFGLMHDIGYYANKNGVGREHMFAGHELMTEKGYDDIARICLTHSFMVKDVRTFANPRMNITEDEKQELDKYIKAAEYDDYDRLIQLADCLGAAEGICFLEKRMVDVTMRHGFTDFTILRWKESFRLKDYFDKLCGTDIYKLIGATY
jgi:putative nucleotidyltransferase with HDIG domain